MDSAGLALLLFVGFLVAIVVAVGASFYGVLVNAFPLLSIVVVALFGIVALALVAMFALNHHNNN
jgi:predicted ABC-type exoprotein transport system permease subunit